MSQFPAPMFAHPQPGDVLAGKYRVERVLGVGGMGVVVSAHHLQLEERVALKFLLPTAIVHPEAVARFTREARAAAKIKNEHVARVTDVGQLETGSPYMVMEYLEGQDLAHWLTERGPLPVGQAVDFILQACEALAEAHVLGIVHRDLKPANLFCVDKPDGSICVKVLDFGISKLLSPGDSGQSSNMTRTSAFLGSPLYMSPEQIETSKGVDTLTDIWALGIVLFELLTGKCPFEAESASELIIKVVTTRAPLLRGARGDAPAGLEAVIDRCLQKDRTQRYQTVGELAIGLQEFASARGRMSTEGVLGTLQRAGFASYSGPPLLAQSAPSGAMTGGQPTSSTWGTPVPTRKNGALGVVVVIGVLLVVAMTAAAALFVRPQGTSGVVAMSSSSQAPVPSTPAASSAPAGSATVASAAPSAGSAEVSSAAPAASSSVAVAASSTPAAGESTAAARTASNANGRGQAISPAHSSAAPKGSAAAPPAADCDPPYTFNADGRKRFKPECFPH